ncbi:MAG: methylated-DNA--[protein]-cysteine S-methyltransferase [Alphaproteobacteria bacterium]
MKIDAPPPRRLTVSEVSSPIGRIEVILDEAGILRGLDFGSSLPRIRQRMARLYPGLALRGGEAPARVAEALGGYFEGDPDALAPLDCATAGTRFQEQVWTALCGIPEGVTRSYLDIAIQVGAPRAGRAVGLANGANPVALLIPCHRVVGRSGALTGYAGGLERKAWLLAHEAASSGPETRARRQSSTVISQ